MSMGYDHLHVDSETHTLYAGDEVIRCAIGKNGVIMPSEKREGDGKTPLGTFPLRMIYVRRDRIPMLPALALTCQDILPSMGWCDDPTHPSYNQAVTLPFAASHEDLWREDHRYDLIIPLGYNDDPILPHNGSAIFFHIASEHYTPTEGCVAIASEDFLRILPYLSSKSMMTIR
jgi:L,D-peptidoglycan transpeptidase YkuD (ErfK/YbiS/YcfS/YnhG family)